MSENEEMSMAQKLEVLRQVTSYGVGSGYEPNGERGPVVIEVPEFEPARSTITEIHSGSPVSSAEFDEPIMTPSAGETAVLGLQIIPGSEAGKYRVTPGRVNGIMPTLSTVLLDAEEPPEITVTETTYVWAKCVGTFGTPDTYAATIETSETEDTPAGTAITATGFVSYYPIGYVEFTAGSPATYEITNQHSGGNLGVDSWGLYNLWWRA